MQIPPTYVSSRIPSFCLGTTYIYEKWRFYQQERKKDEQRSLQGIT